MKFRVGDRVRAKKDAGVHSGKEGTLAPKKEIAVDADGVPVLPGYTVPLKMDEVWVKQDDGNFFAMNLSRLDKLG